MRLQVVFCSYLSTFYGGVKLFGFRPHLIVSEHHHIQFVLLLLKLRLPLLVELLLLVTVALQFLLNLLEVRLLNMLV